MYASMWSYPWDLLDCGMEKALDEMRMNGLTGVSMITSYHAGRFLCVRSPKRKIYFPEDGVLYYPSDLKKFQGQKIQPRTGAFIREHPDFWDRLFSAAEQRNMTVSGWTVCLHNTRIGRAYPEVCVRNAYGDIVYYNQCPSSPDARLYMATLMDDLLSALPLYAVELESMNFMGHAHEFHHEKDGIGLTALHDFLFSLCFCPSCIERARKEGMDILPAQRRVRGWLDEICAGTMNGSDREFLSSGLEYFRAAPEVYEYLQWRSTVVTSLMKEVHQVTSGRSRLFFLSLLANTRSWLFGVDLGKISAECEGIVMCSYDCDEHQAERDIRGFEGKLAPDTKLMVGMRCFTPEYADEAAFARKVITCRNGGVDGFNFYNYGLIPESRLKWIRNSLE